MQRRLFPFFFSACLALLVFLRVGVARAQGAVYVVDVSGDRVDAGRVRAAVGRELSVTAVAPDDARAPSAIGTINVVASAASKTLTVTFHKPEAPVTRTVPLPDDAARAESTAVLLAGNLARDEADELLDGLKKPPRSAQKTPEELHREAEGARDAAELRRAIAVLKDSADAEARRARVRYIIPLSMAAVAGTTGAVLVAGNHSDGSVEAGYVLSIVAIGALGSGVVALLKPESTELRHYKSALEIEKDSATTTEAIAKIDAAWAEWAKSARRSRTFFGALELTLGSLALGAGTVLHLGFPHGTDQDSLKPMLFTAGGIEVLFGIYNLVVESRVETSFQTWRALHETREARETRVRPTFGFAPLPGGGAISMGFAF